VIEGPQLLPLLVVVARFAGERRLMRMAVTGRAGQAVEVILPRARGYIARGASRSNVGGHRRCDARQRLVAIVAKHGRVSSRQGEFRLRMPHRGKCRGLKTVLRVAAIALIQVRRP